MMVKNSRSFTRIVVSSRRIEVTIDIVLPPAAWNISEWDLDEFSHINMNIARVKLSRKADGLLWDSPERNMKDRQFIEELAQKMEIRL